MHSSIISCQRLTLPRTSAGAAAAIRLGLCRADGDVTVKLPGGDLSVRVENGRVLLTGDAAFVYEGEVEI